MATSIQPEQQPPTEDAWRKVVAGVAAEGDDEEQRTAPITSFWQRLIHGVEGKSRLKEIGRSAVRGAAQFVNETEHTAASALKAGLGKIGIGDGETPEKIVSDEDISQVYGRRSDDPLAAFAESATQFAVGFAATGPFAAGAATIPGRIAVAAGRGAVVDAVSFDPDEAGLAELAARAPEGYGIKELGEALSVNPEDHEAIKRAKRSAAGIIPGVVLDVVVAGAQRAWAKGAAKLAKTADEVQRVQRIDKQAGETLVAIAEGRHVPEGAHVVPVDNGDGTFGLKPTAPQFNVELEPDALRSFGDDGPKFKDLSEAQAQAETINFAMNERLQAAKNAGGLTTEQADALRTTFRSFLSAGTPEELKAFFRPDGGTHFNFSYYSEPNEVLSAIESVSQVFKEELDIAQKVGGVSVDDHRRLVQQFIGGLDPEQAPGLISGMLEKGYTTSVALSAADVVLRDIALKSSRLFDLVTARPHDAIAWEEARAAASQLVRLQRVLAGAHSDQGRGLRFLQDRDAIAASVPLNKKQGPKKEVVPVGNEPKTDLDKIRLREQQRMEIHKLRDPKAKPADLGVEKSQDAGALEAKAGTDETSLKSDRNKAEFKSSAEDKAVPRDIAGMGQREVLAVLKMAKMSGGAPSKLPSIAGATLIIQETGFVRRALEWFINSALSNPVTPATALTANALISTFEAGSRMFTGLVSGNKALMREGWDILYGNEAFLVDNFKVAAQAFRQGHSVIRHGEVHQALPGKMGHLIRTPSRALLFADEFTRVSNYRSYVRAKSLRYWRERGLEGPSLAKAVSNDLRDAFDPRTGTATIPEALKYAEVPTMSADLGHDTIGGGLSSFLNNNIEAKFIAPFVKTSVNIFRYTFDRMPGLQFLAKRNREILKEGGEGAAVLMTQTAMATSMYFYGYMKAKSGEITGNGPKNQALRNIWLQDHKPYSIKIDGDWVSYRRLDPIFTPLSLMADTHDMVQELANERDSDAEDVIAGSMAGLAAAFANKSYMVGMTSFFEAWSGGEGQKMKKWLHGIGTTFTNPQILRAINDDPYLREVQSFKDAMWSGIPGLSETLPARFDIFGDPILKYHSFMPAPNRGSAERTVATDLLALKQGIEPMARRTFMGVEMDLNDGQKFGRVNGMTPYEFMQKEIRSPSDGEPSLKQALTELVNSSDYKEASPGSELQPGGERAIMAFGLIDGYRRKARAEMLEAFPLVQTEMEMLRSMKGAAISEGDAGELEVLREFGRSR